MIIAKTAQPASKQTILSTIFPKQQFFFNPAAKATRLLAIRMADKDKQKIEKGEKCELGVMNNRQRALKAQPLASEFSTVQIMIADSPIRFIVKAISAPFSGLVMMETGQKSQSVIRSLKKQITVNHNNAGAKNEDGDYDYYFPIHAFLL